MKLPKHHYIPIFYLKKWAAPDGRLVEFSRPYGDRVKPRRTHPDGTGYVRGLYRLHGLPDQQAEIIESDFLQKVDDLAAVAHQKIIRHDLNNWTLTVRSAWSRFMIGLLVRSPRSIVDIKATVLEGLPEEWERIRAQHAASNPNEPPFAPLDHLQAERMGIFALSRFIDNPRIGTFLNGLERACLDVSGSKHRLLTSDRPVVMTNGLASKNGHIAIAASPTVLYVATHTEEFRRALQKAPAGDVVRTYNKQVVRNAVRYVWAHDESQTALIAAQLSADAKKDRSFF